MRNFGLIHLGEDPAEGPWEETSATDGSAVSVQDSVLDLARGCEVIYVQIAPEAWPAELDENYLTPIEAPPGTRAGIMAGSLILIAHEPYDVDRWQSVIDAHAPV